MEEMTHLALLPSAQQDDWEKYLKYNTKKWQDYTQTINGLEHQINTAVYTLFNLTPEEINLIEKVKQ